MPSFFNSWHLDAIHHCASSTVRLARRHLVKADEVDLKTATTNKIITDILNVAQRLEKTSDLPRALSDLRDLAIYTKMLTAFLKEPYLLFLNSEKEMTRLLELWDDPIQGK